MAKVFINHSVQRIKQGDFQVVINVYDSKLNPIFEHEREFKKTTLIDASYKSLLGVLGILLDDGLLNIDLASDVRPLVNDLVNGTGGTMAALLKRKLQRYGMTLESVKEL